MMMNCMRYDIESGKILGSHLQNYYPCVCVETVERVLKLWAVRIGAGTPNDSRNR